MTLSIFNSKNTRIALSISLSFLLIWGADRLVRTICIARGSDKIVRMLDFEKPDIILLGNSVINHNIDKTLFDRKLSSLAHRNIKSFFLGFGGCHAALFYVVIKNQIAKSQIAGIPLLIADHNPAYFSSRRMSRPERELVKTFLGDHEELFFSKRDDRSFRISYYLRQHCALFYYAREFSRITMTRFVDRICRLSGFKDPTKNLMEARFDSKARYASAQENLDDEIHGSNADRYEKSFLPDIFQEAKRFKLAFVLTHRSPGSNELTQDQQRNKYFDQIRELTDYVQSRGVVLFDMSRLAELNHPSLYSDRVHSNERGAKAQSELLAKMVYDAGLIK